MGRPRRRPRSPKRKNAMEMFEVFRQQRRGDGKNPAGATGPGPGNPPTPGSAAPPPRAGKPLISTLVRPRSLDRRPIKERAESAAPAVPVAALPPATSLPDTDAAEPSLHRLRMGPSGDGPGERAITIRYNTALFAMILLAAALFVAFALGVEVGRDRATRDLSFGPESAGATGSHRSAESPRGAGDSTPGVTPAVGGGGSSVSGTGVESPFAGGSGSAPPAAAGGPTRFYTIRLIHYEPTKQGRERAEQMKAWLAARVGAGVFTATMMINGEPQRAVCYGEYPNESDGQAQEDLKRLKALNAKSFKFANFVHVERAN